MSTPANSMNIAVSGVLRSNSGVVSSSALTNHAVLVGANSNAITSVSASATNNTALQSQGSSSDPAYTSAAYLASTTANRIVYSSATNTMAEISTANNGVLISSNSSVPSMLANGTATNVLTANSGAPPSWQAAAGSSGFTAVNQRIFTSNTTYTPTASTKYVMVEAIGGGAAGGGAAAGGSGSVILGGPGGAGEYARGYFAVATVTGQAITIGAGGTGNTGTGGSGGTTSIGSALTALGGSGGGSAGFSSDEQVFGGLGDGGIGGSSSGANGDVFRIQGQPGATITGALITSQQYWSQGPTRGSRSQLSYFGGSGFNSVSSSSSYGTVGNSGSGTYGGAGSGAVSLGFSSARNGGDGGSGAVVITEYI